MPLIICPDCASQISSRADVCPHCGLPARFFVHNTPIDDTATELAKGMHSIDMSALRNALIAFSHSYQVLFDANHYITARELDGMSDAFDVWNTSLMDGETYAQCKSNAPKYAIDFSLVTTCMRRYEALRTDATEHNARYVDAVVAREATYFDALLHDVDPSIMLDEEQRRAVVTDDDYCLLVAGAGAGKTTTMAAKVKYLVEKKNVLPEDIIVISYTKKAIKELKDRINKDLNIPARICTFHSFAFDFVRKRSDAPPEVSYSPHNIFVEMLEKEIFNDKDLLRRVLLFLGYYFDIPADAMQYGSLNEYHLIKAAQNYESIRSNAGEYVRKIASQRGRRGRTITGEFMRSVQESQIANFLYLNGLDYEYEPIYPHTIYGAKKMYTPDFLISQGEHTAYLEHYAVTENGYSNVLTPQERSKYKKAIADKRRLHRRVGTTLLETWSGHKDGRSIIEHLREILIAEGFVLRERDFSEVYKKIVETSRDKYVEKMVQFLMTFIAQFKTCGYDAGGFAALREKTDNPRTLLFLDIAQPVYEYYQSRLAEQNRIDFEDMINDAHYYLSEIEKQGSDLPYKYIIIDEFQDIARQRFNLTKRLSEITKAKVVAVGDDWQSIFAFSGSEINLFTKFLDLMGSGTELKITHTYRNSQELIDIAGGFVQKNVSQIKKRLVSQKTLSEPVVLMEFDDDHKPDFAVAEAAEHTVERIITEFGENSSILFVGRYNYDSYKLYRTNKFTYFGENRIECAKFPNANITFMTAHSAKGLGFDNVVLLNMFEGKFGFPCQIEDDPIMKLVRFEDTSISFAEERRLFYVALTRTKNRVYILTPQHKPSRFLIELIDDFGIQHSSNLNKGGVDLFRLRCPSCGYPLKYEYNKNYGLNLYLCTNEPEICDFMTNSKTHLHDIHKCDACETGYMIVKTSETTAFYGCTNFRSDPQCMNTQSIM